MDLTDLVDDRYSVRQAVEAVSVRYGLVKFTEAAYYLNVVGIETEKKQNGNPGPQAHIHGSLVQSDRIGLPLSAEECLWMFSQHYLIKKSCLWTH